MIDITSVIKAGMNVYKDELSRQPIIDSNVSSDVYESDIKMNVHTGSHIDYPLHMIPGGKTSLDYDISQYIGLRQK